MLQSQNVSILQVGANDGVSADPIHPLLVRHKNIHATRVEPLSGPFKRLEMNSKRYAATTELLNVCISDHEGTIAMTIPNHTGSGLPNTLHASVAEGGSALASQKESRMEEVRAITFETLLNMMKTPKADVYVSDCEGLDIDLLEQLPITLAGVRVVYIELWDNPHSPESTGEALSRASAVLGRHGFNRIVWDGQDYLSWKSARFSSSRYPEVMPSE